MSSRASPNPVSGLHRRKIPCDRTRRGLWREFLRSLLEFAPGSRCRRGGKRSSTNGKILLSCFRRGWRQFRATFQRDRQGLERRDHRLPDPQALRSLAKTGVCQFLLGAQKDKNGDERQHRSAPRTVRLATTKSTAITCPTLAATCVAAT